ncbi:MAG TPA: DUF4105 domain-containing protein [Candidatus Saccharimonadia bacterium]|nr:DUF4105 domain-containing protein [Candidatus Saccharimonadia bacterium]
MLTLMLFFAASLPAFAQRPGASLEIALVTIGPGEIYWERFGHNAIVVRDTVAGDGRIYHFGIFDFESENFLLEFLRGRMVYLAVAEPLGDFGPYLGAGRSIDVQWLALSPPQRAALRDHLEWHVAPENSRYRYDYYERNCSTKIRDALDLATGGAVRAALDGPSRGVTYRWHTQRLTAPQPWLYLGTHAGLSGYTDAPITYWQEAFVPMELARRLRDVTVTDESGTRVPLVAREQRLAQASIPAPGATPPRWRAGFLLVGVVVAALIGWLAASRRRRTLGALSGALWLFAGLGGALLAALWLLTEHRPAWANENLLLFNPLALGLVPSAFVSRWRHGPYARTMAWLVAASAVVALVAKALPGFRQDNLDWILLWLPIHFALALTLAVRPARA